MDQRLPTTIDEVITALDQIIEFSKKSQCPLGYFAALYRRVTQKVKDGIAQNSFEDGARMEQLDIVFANRYLEAYYAHQHQLLTTDAWHKAFYLKDRYWPIVLQHLIIGINAHICLDLGIAAAEISKGKNIKDLQRDFIQINQILSDLVEEVQDNLSSIWPALKRILAKTKWVDNIIVDFSMEVFRNEAWTFACQLHQAPAQDWLEIIAEKDKAVTQQAKKIASPGWVLGIGLAIIRLGELGSVQQKIANLEHVPS